MTKITANNVSVYISDNTGASTALSSLFNSATLNTSSEIPDVTVFGDNTTERLQQGIKDWTLSINGFWSSAASETDAVLAGIGPGGSTYVVLGPSGSAASGVKYSACAILQDYNVELGVKDSANISLNLAARSGSLTRATW